MLKLSKADYDAIRLHGEETYPHECCGVMLGTFHDKNNDNDNDNDHDPENDDRDKGSVKTVSSVSRCGNTRSDSPHNRYHIDPKDLIRIQREGRQHGTEIVGFYHSHPDHPAQWSATDLAEAHWFGCSYVITSVENGKAVLTNSFELAGADESEKTFTLEKISDL